MRLHEGQRLQHMSLQHSQRIITDGLVLCLDAASRESYPGSGTVWTDLAGSNNGTLINGPTFSSANGGSIVFDGSDDYGYIEANSPAFNFGTSPFSIEVWAYLSDENASYFKTILSIGTYEDGILFRHQPEDDAFYIAGVTWDWNCATVMPQGVWRHLVITKQGSNVKIYANGVLVFSETNAPLDVTPITPDSHIAASSHNTAEVWPGNISTYRVYNGKALTPAEVLQNYNATKGRFNL